MYKLCIFFLLTHLSCNVYAVDKISWTLSKPPMDLFRWETSKANPTYTLTSLSEGGFVLQGIATDADGTSTHSGVIQGNISDTPEIINLVLNPLIQADARSFQQPSYVKWVKTNTSTVYPGDVVEITVKGQSNPPNSDMQFTINDQVKCTSSDECVINHTVPSSASDKYTIQIAIVNMGYSIPVELIVKDFVPVEFRAVFNTPPEITAINSAISLLHQIGASTTITATFSDAEGGNIKYTWTMEALQGTCPIIDLSGDLTDTVASGSTVNVIFTPTTLGNKCIVKLRCEDSQGAVSLGEVYIYVDNVPIYFPPYVVSKLQSKQVAAVDDSVDFSLEMCEPQEQMITVAWSDSSCGTLDHTADTIVSSPDCHWIYNSISLTSVPCSVTWTATDSDGSISTGKFRVLSDSRRLYTELPYVKVETTDKTIKTTMIWDKMVSKNNLKPVEKEIITPDKKMSGEGIALIILSSFVAIFICIGLIVWKKRGTDCVVPEKKNTDIEKAESNKSEVKVEDEDEKIHHHIKKHSMKGFPAGSKRGKQVIIKKKIDIPKISAEQLSRGEKRRHKMEIEMQKRKNRNRLEKTVSSSLVQNRIKQFSQKHQDK